MIMFSLPPGNLLGPGKPGWKKETEKQPTWFKNSGDLRDRGAFVCNMLENAEA